MYIDDGIEYMLGDYDGNTEIDAADASAILTTFSLLQTGNENKLTDSQKKACDIDGDGKAENCVLTYGPTIGLYTVVFNYIIYYNNNISYYIHLSAPLVLI